jgi:hypothetical protein
VERSGIYPVTCLHGLKKGQKQKLLDAGVVLVSELAESPKFLRVAGLSQSQSRDVLDEIAKLAPSPFNPGRIAQFGLPLANGHAQ